MTVGARQMHWTEAEYLAFENASPIRHEYFAGEVFARAGAAPIHNRLAGNTQVSLGLLTRGRGCGTFNSDQRIYVARTGLYTYADGGVACGKWEIHTDGMCLVNPVLLFEVLSPSTRDYDRGVKREHYQQISSLQHLLLIDQPAWTVWHYWRSAGGLWEVSESQDGTIRLPEWEGELALEDIYRIEE